MYPMLRDDPTTSRQQPPWLPVPHPGIPGAIWIPGAGLGAPPPAVEQFFSASASPRPRAMTFERPLILYCHEKCLAELEWRPSGPSNTGTSMSTGIRTGSKVGRKAKLPTEVVQPQMAP